MQIRSHDDGLCRTVDAQRLCGGLLPSLFMPQVLSTGLKPATSHGAWRLQHRAGHTRPSCSGNMVLNKDMGKKQMNKYGLKWQRGLGVGPGLVALGGEGS